MRRLDQRERGVSISDFVDKSDLLSKRQNPRQMHLRERKRKNVFRATLWSILGLVILGFLGLTTILWYQGVIEEKFSYVKHKTLDYSAELGLRLKDIFVEGRGETSREDILEAIGLKSGDPILAFDPKRAKETIEALPWVSHVTIERRLPDSIYVTLTEKKPIAFWQFKEQLSLVDEKGETIPGANRQKYKDLPLIVGENAPKFVPSLFEILEQESHFKNMVSSAVLIGKRRWDIHLKNGMIVKLPEHNAPAAWTQLALLDQEHKLLDRDIAIIDFRLPDRLILKMKSGQEVTEQSKSNKEGETPKGRFNT